MKIAGLGIRNNGTILKTKNYPQFNWNPIHAGLGTKRTTIIEQSDLCKTSIIIIKYLSRRIIIK